MYCTVYFQPGDHGRTWVSYDILTRIERMNIIRGIGHHGDDHFMEDPAITDTYSIVANTAVQAWTDIAQTVDQADGDH